MPENLTDFNHNQPTYSISEIAGAIKRTVEDRFGRLRLRGEISGWKVASSGHVYFRLKDDSAVIDAVIWRGAAGKLAFKPEDGLEVIASGKLTTYPGKSSYQIVVDHMEPAGAGALMAILEKRKKALEAEGLFSPERKKPLPYLPKVVGVITSPTGAVIRDILHRLGERFPLHVLVWPVAVQGEGAAEQIAAAIDGFNNAQGEHRPDVLIVARGGGSIEDLWAFNEEVVVRAAANSRIPLISAVGHETDTTLIDYASDMRAPTPTAAAELATPVRDELRLALSQLELRLQSALQRYFTQRRETVQSLARALPKPAQLLQVAAQRLDDWSERLIAALPALLTRRGQELQIISGKLSPKLLHADITLQQEKLTALQGRMVLAARRTLEQRTQALAHHSALLESMNYERVLARGFALVKDASGTLVTTANTAKQQPELQLVFADGVVKAAPR